MKKLLLFLLISGFAFAQDVEHSKELDSIQRDNVAQEIILSTGKKFVYIGDDLTGKKYTRIYKDSEGSGDESYLNISFTQYYDGKNDALEIKGVKRWFLKAVTGKFLAVAPLWKKYYDEKADFVKMSEEKKIIGSPKDRFALMNKNEPDVNSWTVYFNR